MENKDLKTNVKSNFMNVKNPSMIGTLKKNDNFCTSFFSKQIETTIVDNVSELNVSKELVYSTPYKNNFDAEAINKIIDLLMQLRAASSDQSILVQNNTVLRDQILNQLKSEVLRAGNNLTKNQIENLKVISSNTFDEKTLTDILKSFLESSKKKSDDKSEKLTHLAENKDSKSLFSKGISKNYISVIDRVNYYTKVLDNVFKNVLYNPATKKKSSELKRVNSEDNTSLETLNKTEISRNKISKNKIKQNKIEILDEITKFYEENIISGSSLLPKIIKLQTKISEIGILENVNTIAENVIKKSLPKVLSSETELINKIVNTEKIDKIYEDITLSKEQYENEKAYQERRISRIYNDVRKFNNSKYIIQNISEILKSNKVKGFNLEENIKKNIVKLSTQKSVINKVKNVYDNTIENTIEKNIENKTELVNKENVVSVQKEEINAVKDIVNVKRSGIKIDRDFVENIRQNNILMKDFYVQRKNLTNIHNLSEKVNNVYSEFEEQKNIQNKENLITLKNVDYREIENEILDQKLKEIENVSENKIVNKFGKSLEKKINKTNLFTKNIFLKNKTTRKIFENKIRLKNIYFKDENEKNTQNKENLITLKNVDYIEIENEILDRKLKEIENVSENKIVNKLQKKLKTKTEKLTNKTSSLEERILTELFSPISSKKIIKTNLHKNLNSVVVNKTKNGITNEVLKQKNIYEFEPVYAKENILNETDVEEIISRNNIKVLNPKIIKENITKTRIKNVYRDFAKNKIHKYLENTYDTRKDYLINKITTDIDQNQFRHFDENYMVYKENKIQSEKVKEKPKKEIRYKTKKVGNYSKASQSNPEPINIDTRSIEKNILSKTMSKKDIIDLIESRSNSIDIEAISNEIIEKISLNMEIDRRRNGIF